MNIRRGFATNSSSSHSIIFFDNARNNDCKDYDVDDHLFGWSYFTASSKEAKKAYADTTLIRALTSYCGYGDFHENQDSILSAINALLIKKYGSDFTVKYVDGSIDHQSVLLIPTNWEETNVNLDFFHDLYECLMQDECVIIGGNDNDDGIHEASYHNSIREVSLGIPKEERTTRWTARKDIGGWWTLFNRLNGSKIRVSFDLADVSKVRPSAPELVDMKITDYCDIGCSFCYQNSTIEGKHANFNKIKLVIDELAENKVFEIAFGGGETTQHPDFLEILKYARSRHIVPNFTTKSLKWMEDKKYAKDVIESCGAFAYSVKSLAGLKKFINALSKLHIPRNINPCSLNQIDPTINIQYVMGTSTLDELSEMLLFIEKLPLNVTLLGYKNVGRGSSFKPYNYDGWINILKSFRHFGIDTALAAEFEEELKRENIPSYMYHIEEGTFSMYIDAVANVAGPSSYHISRLQTFTTVNDTWKKIGKEGPAVGYDGDCEIHDKLHILDNESGIL